LRPQQPKRKEGQQQAKLSHDHPFLNDYQSSIMIFKFDFLRDEFLIFHPNGIPDIFLSEAAKKV
jgi:hypothetical protein